VRHPCTQADSGGSKRTGQRCLRSGLLQLYASPSIGTTADADVLVTGLPPKRAMAGTTNDPPSTKSYPP